jgi:PAX-interacting protein 1
MIFVLLCALFEQLQHLKEKYLLDMNELYGMLSTRSNQPMPAEQLQKLKHYKDVLHRMIPYLKVPKERVPKEFNLDKVEAFEKQIVNIMETFKRRRQPQQQQQSLSGGPAGSTQSQPVPSNSGQSQQTPGQQADSTSMPRSLPQLQPQQQQQPQMVCVIFQHFVELLV